MTSAVRTEIEALHAFFVGWFSGSLPEDAFQNGFLDRLADDFLLIPPAGERLDVNQLAAAIRGAHGSNPDFRIAIRAVRVHHVIDDHIVATYEEWQRNALASTPADNGRIATVIFRQRQRLEWLHVHETWLPAEVMAAGPYDF